MQDSVARTPVHLWIVGVVSLLWNLIGAVDYLMTRMRNTDYLANMMPNADPQEVLAWVDAFPFWAQLGWALGVWFGVAGSILLLARKRMAMHCFLVSLIGILLGIGYQLVAAPPPPGSPEQSVLSLMPYVVILVGVALYFYSRALVARDVLR